MAGTRDYKDTAGAIYADLVKAELEDEWERKRSIEQRGQIVVSTVGVIAGIAFTAASLAPGTTPVSLPIETQIFIWEGVVFLVGAAVFGLRANWPLEYEAAAASELERLIRPAYWDADPSLGSRRAAEVRIAELSRARATNGNKAWALAWGMNLEVLGTIMLALGVAFAMAGPSVDSGLLVGTAVALTALPIAGGVFGLTRALWRRFVSDSSGGDDRVEERSDEVQGGVVEGAAAGSAEHAVAAGHDTRPSSEGPVPDNTTATERTTTAPNLALEFATHVHRYLQDQIVLADAKAGIAAAVAGGLFVAYREITSMWPITASIEPVSVARVALQLVTLLALLGTVVHAYRTLAPRMPSRYRRARLEFLHRLVESLARGSRTHKDLLEGGGLVRWPDLADRARFASPSAYADSVSAAGASNLTRNVAEHSIVLANIVAEKHQQVRAVVNYLLVAGIAVALMSLLRAARP